jgi:hypothetical protein
MQSFLTKQIYKVFDVENKTFIYKPCPEKSWVIDLLDCGCLLDYGRLLCLTIIGATFLYVVAWIVVTKLKGDKK